jgi:hypothetical protein
MSLGKQLRQMAVTAIACGWLCLAAGTLATAQDQSVASAASTFASRLSGVEHVGLQLDEKSADYHLYVYSAQRQQQNVAELKEFLAKVKDYSEWQVDQRARFEAARERGASSEELREIEADRRGSPLIRPSIFYRQVSLRHVVSLGEDYIELESALNPSNTTLIPLRKLGMITFVKDAPAEDDE